MLPNSHAMALGVWLSLSRRYANIVLILSASEANGSIYYITSQRLDFAS